MQKKIIKIVAALCALTMLFACSSADIVDIGIMTSFPEYNPDLPSQEICSIDGVTMSLNPGTMQIDIETDDWFWSSYDFYNAKGTSASTSFSLFEIECATIGGEKTVLDAYVDCIKKKQFKVRTNDETGDGFTATFVAGKVSKDRALPEIATKEQMEEWLAQIEPLSSRMAKQIKLAYTFFTYEDDPEYVSQYPALGTYQDGIYVLKTDVTDREKEIWEEYFVQIGLDQDFVVDLHQSMNYTPQSKNNPVVQFDMIFTIEKGTGDLIVEVPASSFIFDNESYAINSISILESLCCVQAGTDDDDTRFIFFPDGSGVVAQTNSENGEGLLAGTVYNAVTDKLGGYYHNAVYGYENIFMPVFGYARENVSALAIIEEGAEATRITANYTNATVNSVYPTIMFEEYTASRVDEMVELSERYTVDSDFNYRVRYKFMSGSDVDYIDMAKLYRKYLIENGQLNDVDKDIKTGYYLETLGYVKGIEDTGLISVEKDKVLTSFEDNIEMIDKLTAAGVSNISLKLNGWSNGGMSNKYTTKIKLSKEMGGEDGWNKLVDYVTKNNIGFYPNVNFMAVSAVSAFDGFSAKKLAIRDNYNTYNGIGTYIGATKLGVGFSYIINPAKLLTGINKFYKKSANYVSNGISVDYIGSILVKDYSDDNQITRSESKDYIEEALKTISEKNPLMLTSANQYAWKYADVMLNMPNNASQDPAVETVPFMQIVLHGSKAITGAAINTDNSYEDAVLDAMLYAQGVYFTMAKSNIMYLKESVYSFYYSVDASYWIDASINAYKLVNDTVGDCMNVTIENFERISENVYRTTFSNGKWIMVNYGREDIEVEIFAEEEETAPSTETAPSDEEGEETEKVEDAEDAPATEPEPELQPAEKHQLKAKGYKTSDGKEGTVIG